MNPLGDLARAAGFLTVLPVGRQWPTDGAGGAVGFYAWVGWGLGGVAWSIAELFGLASARGSGGSLLAAALVVGAWAAATRMLHFDGLADAADGLLGASTREPRLAIMRDSATGAFGATAIALVAILQVAALVEVLGGGRLWVLVVAPVLGRAAVSVAAWTLPAAREDGLGHGSTSAASVYSVCATLLAVAGLLVLGHLTAPAPAFFITMAVGLTAGFAVPRLLAAPVGGMTGDLMGATILLVETAVLVTGGLVR